MRLDLRAITSRYSVIVDLFHSHICSRKTALDSFSPPTLPSLSHSLPCTMAAPNEIPQPQPPSSPVADPDRARALLRELSASMGVAPDSEEGLAALQAFIRSSSTSARSTTPPPLQAPTSPAVTPPDAPVEDAAPGTTERLPTESATDPFAPRDVLMGEAPTSPADDSTSRGPPPSQTPSRLSSTSTLTPSTSPVRAPATHETTLEHDERVEPRAPGTPPVSTPARSIPADSPLVSRAQLTDPRSGARPDAEMEWRMYGPNCRLELVSRESKDDGCPVYPPVPCSTCTEGKAVCTGVNGIKCARCKGRHSVCSLYQDTFEGRARSRALIKGRKFVESQLEAGPSTKPESASTVVTRSKKRVRVESPTPSSSPASNDSPAPSSCHSCVAVASAFRDVVVAAANDFVRSLENQGSSSKGQGKRRA